ncbi:hypothetical protein B0H10DRAFT_1951833 [Mycena sp. CBHHK59/15]|nr:hypothetical protein B0H10DRAFT_1951833 [Mycena sp. CBHHK59/15]
MIDWHCNWIPWSIGAVKDIQGPAETINCQAHLPSPLSLSNPAYRKCLKQAISSLAISGPDGSNVIGLWSDLSTGESYACTLDKQALARGCLSSSANNLQDFADAIPDTHGLMIHAVWQGLPPIIRHQISPNHATWESFCNVLRELRLDIETVPPLLPLPWHRHTLPGHIPYHIGMTPSKSGLVVKLNCHMPELFRGRDPDPTNTKKKKKARSVSPQSDDMELEDLTVPSQPPKASHGEGTDLSRYFWLCYALPVLSSTALSARDAISSAGMRLVSLVYDARKTIMNLGTVFIQIYTCKQWNGITQVPRGVRFARHLAIIASSIMVAAYSQGPTKEEGEEADLHRQIQNQIQIQAKFDRSHLWLFSLIYIHIITGSSISIHVHVIVRFCGAI